MKRILVLAVGAVLAVSPAFAAKKDELKTKKEKTSYAVGYNIGVGLKRNLEAQSVEFDAEVVKRGLSDALTGAAAAVPEKEIMDILTNLQKDLDAKRQESMAKQQKEMKEQGEKNKKEGEKFLKENADKEGVKTLPSGLQYKVLAEGKGKQPKATDTVTVNYAGTLIDGTEFDSSYKRGTPASFPLDRVIKGWTEGIQLMKEGGKIQLFIPSGLGYKDQGAGQLIGPNAVLIFTVELISVQQAAEGGAAPATPAK